MEPYEKIYVSADFLNTDHGEIGCEVCHRGDPQDPDWRTAHKGVVKDPTFPDPGEACGECHEEIAGTAPRSLHYTLAPFARTIEARADKKNPKVLGEVRAAVKKHCTVCHSSCGQCHVSRPNYVEGGFLSRHVFMKRPPMDTTCASCHGGRVHAEFTGQLDGVPGDVHYEKHDMECMDCHKAGEMHADASGVGARHDLASRPRCEGCHPDAVSEKGGVESHTVHRGKLACQACHSKAYKNCFNCHVGTDEKGLPYFKSSKGILMFKVGLNPLKSKERAYDFAVLRHPSVDPGLFDFYVKGGLSNFDALPTWKLSFPHNIQRETDRTKSCSACHGNPDVFLKKRDVDEGERDANRDVIVPPARLPGPLEQGRVR